MLKQTTMTAALAGMLATLPCAAAGAAESRPAPPFKGTNCQLQAPPQDAHKTVLHGFTMFTYPKPRPAAYTGCQTGWMGEEGSKEGSRLLFVAYFEAGKVTKAWMNEEPDERPPQVCRYDKDERLIGAKAGTRCLEGKEWREP